MLEFNLIMFIPLNFFHFILCNYSLLEFFFITPILNYNLSGYRIISNFNVAKWDVDASSMKNASLSIQ